MSFIGDIIGGITGSTAQAKAGQAASATQAAGAQQGIGTLTDYLAAVQQAFAPYQQAGAQALTGQQDLLGTNGAGAQQSAISALQGSPLYTSQLAAGENSILQNASATGGLRGGNTQATLAQFSPQLLAQLIQQQYSQLGSMSGMGLNATGGLGNATIATGNSIAELLQQQAAAKAGGQIAAGNQGANNFNSLLKAGSVASGFF